MSYTARSLTKLQQERAELLDEADKLMAVVETTEDADERAAIETQVDAIMDRAEVLNVQIERADRLAKSLDKLGGKREENKGGTYIDLGTDMEKKPVTIPATARIDDAVNFKRETIHGMTPNERAYAFGRYMLATAARTLPGQYGHLSRYIEGHQDSFGPMNAATEGGNAGIWVPTQFGTDLISLMSKYGVARQLCNIVPMTSDKRTDPKEGSDPTPTFTGEGDEATDVTPTDDRTVTLTAKKLTAILINSSELNEDAIMAFGDSMMRRLANGFAAKEDNCLFNGDGTSTYGGMVGIRTLMQDIDGGGTDAAGLITGTTGSGAAFGSFALVDLEGVMGALPDLANSAEDNAVWVCHKAFYFNVMFRLAMAAGGVTADEIFAGAMRKTFGGYPVVFSNTFPSTAATSTVFAAFGDFRRAVSFGDRRAYSISFSEQATVGSVNLWSSDQIGIKATERFDIQCHSLGDSTTAGAVVALESASS